MLTMRQARLCPLTQTVPMPQTGRTMARPKKELPADERIMVRLERGLHSRLKATAALERKELAVALDEAVTEYLKKRDA